MEYFLGGKPCIIEGNHLLYSSTIVGAEVKEAKGELSVENVTVLASLALCYGCHVQWAKCLELHERISGILRTLFEDEHHITRAPFYLSYGEALAKCTLWDEALVQLQLALTSFEVNQPSQCHVAGVL